MKADIINDEKCKFIKYANSSLSNPERFASFVGYAEHFCELKGIFLDQEKKDEYKKKWFDLEIINSLVLSDCNYYDDAEKAMEIWNKEYKEDASKYMKIFLQTLD